VSPTTPPGKKGDGKKGAGRAGESKAAAAAEDGPYANTPDVTLLSPPSDREVPWNFLSFGTAVNGVTTVQLKFTYDYFNGSSWVSDTITTTATPQLIGSDRVWDKNIGVAKDGKNGVLLAYNAAPTDGTKAENLTIKQDPGIGSPRGGEQREWAAGLVRVTGGNAPDYSLVGTYNPALGGTDVLGVVTPLTQLNNPVQFVEAAAGGGIWVMLFDRPAGTPPPYAMTPYLLDGTGTKKAVGLARILR
jgi:hypothetical protein